jgi:probable F420-dependent oxidoreductase
MCAALDDDDRLKHKVALAICQAGTYRIVIQPATIKPKPAPGGGRMQIGIGEIATTAGQHGGPWIVGASRFIESLGFESIWVPERVFSAPSSPRHPHGADREMDAIRGNGLFEPIAVLGAIAASTSAVRIGTYVHLTALRHPLLTAQQIATIDQLSGGRVEYGAGVGWFQHEFDVLGIPWSTRGRRTTEHLAAIRAIWDSDNVLDFKGEFTSFSSIHVGPRPFQRPHPPILIGGNSAAALRRIVAVGDGWLGYGLDHAAVKDFVVRLRRSLEDAGRDPCEVHLNVGLRFPNVASNMRPDEVDRSVWRTARDYIEGCQELGIERVILTTRIPVDGYEKTMFDLAQALGLTQRSQSA